MVWFYVKHGKHQGSVDEAEFGEAASSVTKLVALRVGT